MKEVEEKCCFCLCTSNVSFTKLNTKNYNGVTHIDKICSSLQELGKILNEHPSYDLKLCGQCCDTIEMVYQFNRLCLKNIAIFFSDNGFVEIKTEIEQCNSISKSYVDEPETTNETVAIKTEPFMDLEQNNDVTNVDEEIIVKQEVEDPLSFLEICQDDVGITGSNRTYKSENDGAIIAPSEENGVEERIQHGGHFLNFTKNVTTDKTESEVVNNQIEGAHNGEHFLKIFLINTKNLPLDKIKSGGTSNQTQSTNSEKNNENHTKKFICKQCGKKFKYKHHLNDHLLVHSGFKPYSCDICAKKFSSKSNLKKHMETHSSEKDKSMKKHQCDVCTKAFNCKSHLDQHKLIHSGEKPFSCDLCGKQFRQKSYIVKHKRITHKVIDADSTNTSSGSPSANSAVENSKDNEEISIEENSLEATDNNTSIDGIKDDKSAIQTQEQKQEDEKKKFICEQCGMMFGRKHHLQDHYRVHSGERPYCCHICGMLFRTQNVLRNHLFLHSDQPQEKLRNKKIFKCELCDNVFKDNRALIRHKLLHDDEQPFSCDICGKKFNHNIDNYIYKHKLKCESLGERPFACKICGKKCLRKKDLATHMQVHSDEKPYSCDICNKKFTEKRNFKKHQQIFHNSHMSETDKT